jgi:hypothetical protein
MYIMGYGTSIDFLSVDFDVPSRINQGFKLLWTSNMQCGWSNIVTAPADTGIPTSAPTGA